MQLWLHFHWAQSNSGYIQNRRYQQSLETHNLGREVGVLKPAYKYCKAAVVQTYRPQTFQTMIITPINFNAMWYRVGWLTNDLQTYWYCHKTRNKFFGVLYWLHLASCRQVSIAIKLNAFHLTVRIVKKSKLHMVCFTPEIFHLSFPELQSQSWKQ